MRYICKGDPTDGSNSREILDRVITNAKIKKANAAFLFKNKEELAHDAMDNIRELQNLCERIVMYDETFFYSVLDIDSDFYKISSCVNIMPDGVIVICSEKIIPNPGGLPEHAPLMIMRGTKDGKICTWFELYSLGNKVNTVKDIIENMSDSEFIDFLHNFKKDFLIFKETLLNYIDVNTEPIKALT